MKIKKLISLTVFVLVTGVFAAKLYFFPSTTWRDFEVLAGKGTPFFSKLSIADKNDIHLFKENYLKVMPTLQRGEKRIPKVLHYIWLGPKPFPSSSYVLVKSWLDNHPGWKVKFWTDETHRSPPDVRMEKHFIPEVFSPFLSSFLDKTDNFGEKSDLLRYEILYREGGIYVDHDIECFNAFDALVDSVDFFAALEPPHKNDGIETRVFPCNALIGARPQHPIFLKTIYYVAQRWNEVEKQFPLQDAKSKTLKVLNRTFHAFTLGVKEEFNSLGNKDLMLPASYLYPDRIVMGNTFEEWKAKGWIWASHKCAGIWKPSEQILVPIEQLDEVKESKRLLHKKYKTMRKAFIASLSSCALLLIFLARAYRKQKQLIG
ncbi:MAG: hypothetical protein EBZ47_03170 [Chlamydiae bacterium]|nr:hypothetical protein [Chlamydiota bacterium]